MSTESNSSVEALLSTGEAPFKIVDSRQVDSGGRVCFDDRAWNRPRKDKYVYIVESTEAFPRFRGISTILYVGESGEIKKQRDQRPGYRVSGLWVDSIGHPARRALAWMQWATGGNLKVHIWCMETDLGAAPSWQT